MGTTSMAVVVYCVLAICSCFLVAQISYRTIEMGGIRLGERLRRPPKPAMELL
jgi:peptidoglycan/LPS O-acetylase OafA/YrhL